MREQLLELGFKELPHFTIGNSLVYDLGRDRNLSMSCIGTPNEMLFICEKEEGSIKQDVIVLRNYDFNGYTTIEEIKELLNFLNKTK